MSLARAFTNRRARQTLDLRDSKASNATDTTPQRSKTLRGLASTGSIRNKISAPVKLTHTTNMLAYNAPDIHRERSNSVAMFSPLGSSKSFDSDSDSASTAASTPPTSPEMLFPDDKRSASPEPNHLSCYFTAPKAAAAATETTSIDSAIVSPAPSTTSFSASAAPVIPQRAPSHTKKSYDSLSRHTSLSRLSEHSRSLSSKGSFSFSRSSSTSTSTSVSSASPQHQAKPSFHLPSISASAPPPAPVSLPASHRKEYSDTHPFGKELAKVSELFEEFGKEDDVVPPKAAARAAPPPLTPSTPARPATRPSTSTSPMEEEERELIRLGLKKFSAEDYLSEIHGLVSSFLADVRPVAAMWI